MNDNICIGIITPSFWPWEYFTQRIERAIKNATDLWFRIKFGENALKSSWYVSASPELRAKDFMNMFLDKEVDIVMTMIWGNHSNQILKYIDRNLIKNSNKKFIGYSDVSVLHFAILTQTNVKAYYWPAFITQFGEYKKPIEYTIKNMNKVLFEEEKEFLLEKAEYWTDECIDRWDDTSNYTERKLKKNEWRKRLKTGIAQWPIIWWCIQSINHLLWTKYWPEIKWKIFFLDLPEWHEIWKWISIADVDSFLADLDNIWLFDDIGGLLVWRPYNYDIKQKEQLENIIKYYTLNKEYPVVLDVDIGHTDPIATIKMLSNVYVNSDEDMIKFTL